MNNLDLDQIKHLFIADLQLCQTICGLYPSAMATHSCLICEWKRKNHFKRVSELFVL